MEKKKYNIVGGPTLDAMFNAFKTRDSEGISFQLFEGEVFKPDRFFVSSIAYICGGTQFELEGYYFTDGGLSQEFSATYRAREQSGTIVF